MSAVWIVALFAGAAWVWKSEQLRPKDRLAFLRLIVRAVLVLACGSAAVSACALLLSR